MSPMLSIAIPTKNRISFLKKNLEQLKSELTTIPTDVVEIIVSDNNSDDGTHGVVNALSSDEFKIRYVRNSEDIGWAANFIQCFNISTAKYVLILGDDDFLVDGAVRRLINTLEGGEYGVVCLQPYGFDVDWIEERPLYSREDINFKDSEKFLLKIGALSTLISSCVINKELFTRNIPANFKNLPILYIVLCVASEAKNNYFIRDYLVGCKRNNSSNYTFSDIFVNEFWGIFNLVFLEKSPELCKKMSNYLLSKYYPYYILYEIDDSVKYKANKVNFRNMFKGKFYYWLFIHPIFFLPKSAAKIYAFIVVLIGRIIAGDGILAVYKYKFKIKTLFNTYLKILKNEL